jgi:DNA-binding CsgD family transcriptional regulator
MNKLSSFLHTLYQANPVMPLGYARFAVRLLAQFLPCISGFYFPIHDASAALSDLDLWWPGSTPSGMELLPTLLQLNGHAQMNNVQPKNAQDSLLPIEGWLIDNTSDIETNVVARWGVYRATPYWNAEEIDFFSQVVPHLSLAYRINAERYLHSLQPLAAAGLCDSDGRRIHLSSELHTLLLKEWPNWRGSHVPFCPATRQGVQRGQRIQLRWSALKGQRKGERRQQARPPNGLERRKHVGLYLLEANSLGPTENLSPREYDVACRYALGAGYKLIAQESGLSPATVRSYLQTIYQKLNVSNKLELASVLAFDPSAIKPLAN